LFFKSNPSL